MNSRNGAAKSNDKVGMFMVFHYDACSDHNITSRMCGHVGGHAYSVSVLKWLLHGLAHSISNCKSQTYF